MSNGYGYPSSERTWQVKYAAAGFACLRKMFYSLFSLHYLEITLCLKTAAAATTTHGEQIRTTEESVCCVRELLTGQLVGRSWGSCPPTPARAASFGIKRQTVGQSKGEARGPFSPSPGPPFPQHLEVVTFPHKATWRTRAPGPAAPGNRSDRPLCCFCWDS